MGRKGIVWKTIEYKVDFSSTELSPLYQLILENNPRLEENTDFPYWYERKKEC